MDNSYANKDAYYIIVWIKATYYILNYMYILIFQLHEKLV